MSKDVAEACVLVRVAGAADPLAAAAAFHADVLPGLLSGAATEPLVLLFAPADHTHAAWRAAAVAGLARALVPRRVNALVGDEARDARAIAATLAWLAAAPGLTGQLHQLDGTSAAPVVNPVP